MWASWGASKMGNSASLEMVCKGLNTFYRRALCWVVRAVRMQACARAAHIHSMRDMMCVGARASVWHRWERRRGTRARFAG